MSEQAGTGRPGAPCGHPVSDLGEQGECHGTDPFTGEPCQGIFEPRIFRREREILQVIIIPARAGERCGTCGKPVAQGRFCRTGDDGRPLRNEHPPYEGIPESFHAWRHADGTPGHGPDGSAADPDRSRCPSCRATGTVTVRDTGYGVGAACTACGWSSYYDRGD